MSPLLVAWALYDVTWAELGHSYICVLRNSICNVGGVKC